jgi:hypothetical protein
MRKLSTWLPFLLGLLLVGFYWYWVHPSGFARGYTEDWCHPEITRQLMAEALERTGAPSFATQAYVAPNGTTLPFMAWATEVSWLGSWFWRWNRDFPFLWAWFGFSLLVSYLGSGYFLRKSKLGPWAAWGLAAAAVVFHVPRHFKTWHHSEHLFQHWIYLGLFIDAWIWSRWVRDRRWSIKLELWRGFFLLGVLGTAGYFWGPMIIEWSILRFCLLGSMLLCRRRREPFVIERSDRAMAMPVLLIAVWLMIDIRWFIPWVAAAKSMGSVESGLGWFTSFPYIVRPLWFDAIGDVLNPTRFARSHYWNIKPFLVSETVVTVGWFLWIPVLVGARRIMRTRGGPGLRLLIPFLAVIAVATLYISNQRLHFQGFIQSIVPTMEFFRVASRWGLFLPPLLVVLIALCWPELSLWAAGFWRRRRPLAILLGVLFAMSSLAELSYLLRPVSTMPPMDPTALKLLGDLRSAPGTTVLDMPFCMVGGNGVCGHQCPTYPTATMGGCLRGWHDKNVYGVYAGRLVPSQCQAYDQQPYVSWFAAWREQRCLKPQEWDELCRYLDGHPELSAILVYPELWTGASSDACRAQFDAKLGKPVAEARLVMAAVRGAETPRYTRLWRYEARCLK